MAYVTKTFQAYLAKPLDADAVHIPLSVEAYTDLLQMLSEAGSYTYLTIKDDTHMETVKIHAEGGYLLMDRGQGGTEPTKLNYGACVTTVSPTIVAVIKDIFCNYTCCEGSPCACDEVTLADYQLPDGNVGVAWGGTITLSGTLPIEAEINGAPEWMTVVQTRNTLQLSGTPTEAASISLQVKATNCGKAGTLTHVLQLVINE